MMLSVEVSMYPLQDEPIPKIEEFLQSIINQNDLVEIRVTNMSSRLFGEFDNVTSLLNQAMKLSMSKYGKIVFICKYLEGDARGLVNYQ